MKGAASPPLKWNPYKYWHFHLLAYNFFGLQSLALSVKCFLSNWKGHLISLLGGVLSQIFANCNVTHSLKTFYQDIFTVYTSRFKYIHSATKNLGKLKWVKLKSLSKRIENHILWFPNDIWNVHQNMRNTNLIDK